MFRSARFKLTLFYLAAVLAVSLTMSLGTRWLAQHEYERSNLDQRGTLRVMMTRLYGLPDPFDNEDAFGFQERLQAQVSAKLDQYVLLINLGALVIGGPLSYWFAGRTLRPIELAHDAQKRFASDASHELRTPLTAIKLENEVFLRQKDFSGDEARQLIESNLEEVDRLERLATNLLVLTHYETAQLDIALEDVERIVGEAVTQTKRTYPAAKIAVSLKPARVLVHSDSVQQMIAIILENACKYSGDSARVTVTGKKQDGGYALVVDDQGPGIPEADLPHVFERLYRGDKARSSAVSGHGLGLALARRIAQANHAEISASNVPDGGARFTMTLQTPRRVIRKPSYRQTGAA
ncbi:hypothetical protein CR970_02475 [Candidatus Saccharibacteria bacterium]|nr:MAG: hypothetical protein CR970_02475 [Candidatus Saccharibacteria bacterium]